MSLEDPSTLLGETAHIRSMAKSMYELALAGGGGAGGDLLAANNLSDLANAATARTNLGLDTMATQAANAVVITAGTITGLTDFGVAMANNTAITGINLGTITDTTSRPFTIAQTWNNAGLTAVGLDISITNTSSSASSKLMQISSGGMNQFEVATNARIGFTNVSGNNSLIYSVANGGVFFGTYASGNVFGGFGPAGQFYVGPNTDAILNRHGSAAIVMGAPLASAWVNQSFGAAGAIVGTSTDLSPTNFMRLHGSISTGTGTGGDLILGVYGTNGVSGTAIGTFNTVMTVVGARKVLNVANFPTSSAGLSAGDVYLNAGVLTVA